MASDMGFNAVGQGMFVSILLLAYIAGYFVQKYRFRYGTEGSVALVVAMVSAGFFYLAYDAVSGSFGPLPRHLVRFNDDVFFGLLLPPIIFYAGFSIRKKLFFQNLITVFAFGVVGTIFSTALLSVGAYWLLRALDMHQHHALQTAVALGAIFSSTDTVATLQILDKDRHPVLYSLIFGEGVVNDAVAIVMLSAAQQLSSEATLTSETIATLLVSFTWLFINSTLLGVGVGLASALVIRYVLTERHTDRDVLVLGLFGFLSYQAAAALGLSSILAVFFCGVTMSHYTWHSLTESARALTLHTFRIMATLAETILFVYSGIDAWTTALWRSGLRALELAAALLGMLVLARAAFIFPTCALGNRLWRKSHKIKRNESVVIWWAGTIRGAITLALTYHHFYRGKDPNHDDQIVIVAAILVVLVTTVGFGAVTGPLMEWLLDRNGGDDGSESSEPRPFARRAPLPPYDSIASDLDFMVHLPLLPGAGRANDDGECAREQGAAPAGEDEPPLGWDRLPLQRPSVPPVELQRRRSGPAIERLQVRELWRFIDHMYLQPVFGGSSVAVARDNVIVGVQQSS